MWVWHLRDIRSVWGFGFRVARLALIVELAFALNWR